MNLEDLLVSQNFKCIFSGDTLVFKTSGEYLHTTEQTISLDRKNSDLGYIEGNVQWVTKTVNFMKRFYSDEEFFNTCLKIANNYKYENTNK